MADMRRILIDLNIILDVLQARAIITNLLQILKITPLDQNALKQALNLNYSDFKDAVQMISAVQNNIDCLITRNKKEFQPTLIPVIQPVEFLSTLGD